MTVDELDTHILKICIEGCGLSFATFFANLSPSVLKKHSHELPGRDGILYKKEHLWNTSCTLIP